MAQAARYRPPRPSQETYTSPSGLRVITYVGDIETIVDANAIVTGEDKELKNESFITKTLLQISPLEFAEKRHQLKRKSRSLKSWTVHTSKLADPTHFEFVFHAVMKQVDGDKWVRNMKKMYKKVFKKAEKYEVKCLVLPLLGSGRANASTPYAVQAAIEGIAGFRNNRHLWKVYLVTLDKEIADSMASQCAYNFNQWTNTKRGGLRGSLRGLFRSGSRKGKRDKTAQEGTSAHERSESQMKQSITFPRTHQSASFSSGSMKVDKRRSRKPLSEDLFNPAHAKYSEDKKIMYNGHGENSDQYARAKRHSPQMDRPGPCQCDDRLQTHGQAEFAISKMQTAVIECPPQTATLVTGGSARERTTERGYPKKDVNASSAIGNLKDIKVANEEKFQTTAVIYDAQKSRRDNDRSAEIGLANQTKDDNQSKRDKVVNMLDLSVSKNCPICINPITDPKILDKCGHVFCSDCIDDSFKQYKPVCPSCNMVYGVLTGNQPDGTMDVGFSGDHLPGYEGYGTITITYYFPSGIQRGDHPNPGQPYKGTTRRAYLPDSSQGRMVLKLLKTAFDRKLTFTIGRSTTTGQENVVTWNDIHHKTNVDGGPTRFGYPDPGYLNRVKEELASKGVAE